MPLLKAIEHGIRQTESPVEIPGRCGVVDLVTSYAANSKSVWNSAAVEGESPVEVNCKKISRYLE